VLNHAGLWNSRKGMCGLNSEGDNSDYKVSVVGVVVVLLLV